MRGDPYGGPRHLVFLAVLAADVLLALGVVWLVALRFG